MTSVSSNDTAANVKYLIFSKDIVTLSVTMFSQADGMIYVLLVK
jgi:hypothetical protein